MLKRKTVMMTAGVALVACLTAADRKIVRAADVKVQDPTSVVMISR